MKTMTKKEKMYQRIEKHGENLNRIFDTKLENLTLCKKLFRIEHRLHYLAEQYCNGVIESEVLEKEWIKAQKTMAKIGVVSEAIFFNQDPRGCALKLEDNYVKENNIQIEKDWGGYGLLAPDFNE